MGPTTWTIVMPRRLPERLAVLALLIGLLSAVSLAYFNRSEIVVSFWPANALALAFLLRACEGRGQQAWALAVTLATLAGVGLFFGRTPTIAMGFACANVVEIAVAAEVLRGSVMPLEDERGLMRLVLGGLVLGPFTSAIVAGAAIGLSGGTSAALAGGAQWLVADAVGMAVFAPVFLSIHPLVLPERVGTQGLIRAVGAQLLLALATGIVFYAMRVPLLFVVTPLVVLAVWTGRSLGGAVAVAGVAIIAVAMTVAGHGPIAKLAGTQSFRLLALQAFVAVQGLTAHAVAAALNRLDAYAQAAEAAKREAESTSAARGELLAHVSQEIRSPLNGVTGMIRLLKAGSLGELNAVQRESLARIGACAEEIESLSADLIDTAAVTSGRLSVTVVATPLRATIEAAMGQARFRAAAFDPVVGLEEPLADDLAVDADPRRLKQILVNLMVNAARCGGRPPHVRVSVSTRRERVRILIDDNGPGGSLAMRAALFDPLERLGAEKTAAEGSGLGLALSRELAAAQGGAIGVESGALGGARVWLELNRAPADAEAANDRAPRTPLRAI